MRHYFLEEILTHRIRFNPIGITRFRSRFAEIGIRLDQIQTRSQFERALELSFEYQSQKYMLNRDDMDEYLSEDDFDDEGDIF